jgi:hypothetical protein
MASMHADSPERTATRVRIFAFVFIPLGVRAAAAVDYGLGGGEAALTTLGLGLIAWACATWVLLRPFRAELAALARSGAHIELLAAQVQVPRVEEHQAGEHPVAP